MTVKDLIWVTVAQRLNQEQDFKQKEAFHSSVNSLVQSFYLMLADLREIMYDISTYTRLDAIKETRTRFEALPLETLPSNRSDPEKEKARLENMSEEERQAEEIKNFLAGKKYRPR